MTKVIQSFLLTFILVSMLQSLLLQAAFPKYQFYDDESASSKSARSYDQGYEEDDESSSSSQEDQRSDDDIDLEEQNRREVPLEVEEIKKLTIGKDKKSSFLSTNIDYIIRILQDYKTKKNDALHELSKTLNDEETRQLFVPEAKKKIGEAAKKALTSLKAEECITLALILPMIVNELARLSNLVAHNKKQLHDLIHFSRGRVPGNKSWKNDYRKK